MINTDFRTYNYYLQEINAYGAAATTDDIKGQIKLAIYPLTESEQIKSNKYIALTRATIDESFVIDYEGEKLKVLYVVKKGRYKQVYLNII